MLPVWQIAHLHIRCRLSTRGILCGAKRGPRRRHTASSFTSTVRALVTEARRCVSVPVQTLYPHSPLPTELWSWCSLRRDPLHSSGTCVWAKRFNATEPTGTFCNFSCLLRSCPFGISLGIFNTWVNLFLDCSQGIPLTLQNTESDPGRMERLCLIRSFDSRHKLGKSASLRIFFSLKAKANLLLYYHQSTHIPTVSATFAFAHSGYSFCLFMMHFFFHIFIPLSILSGEGERTCFKGSSFLWAPLNQRL